MSGQCRGTCNAVGLAGLVTIGHKPFVTQRQLHTRLNEAYPTVWLEVCVRVCVGVSLDFCVFFSLSVKCLRLCVKKNNKKKERRNDTYIRA